MMAVRLQSAIAKGGVWRGRSSCVGLGAPVQLRDGGPVGSHGLQRPHRVAANRIDIPNQPLVLLRA
jgi:hypothetical protein